LFYWRKQAAGPRWLQIGLGTIRGGILALLVLTLAEPMLQLDLANRLRPLIYVVIDGTESMAIDDELPVGERAAINRAIGVDSASSSKTQSRIQDVQSLLASSRNNLLSRLQAEQKAEIETFIFDGNTTSQLRRIRTSSSGRSRAASADFADQLRATGQVT